jgi:hypothetical protein
MIATKLERERKKRRKKVESLDKDREHKKKIFGKSRCRNLKHTRGNQVFSEQTDFRTFHIEQIKVSLIKTHLHFLSRILFSES